MGLLNKKDAASAVVDDKPKYASKADAMAQLKARYAKNRAAQSKTKPKEAPPVDDPIESDSGEVVDKKYNGHRVNKRPATRKELRQRAQARRQEDAIRKNDELNKIRVQKGKKTKATPGSEEKVSIWEKIAENKLYDLLGEMGDTKKAIDKFQRKRMLLAGVVMLVGLIFGALISPWLYIVGPILGFVIYKMQLRSVESFYRGWKFQRQLNFSKFTRLVIPYLKASGGSVALYTIFNKILQRTTDEADRRNLYQLMGEMGDKPQDIQPFLDYAERSSGTDMSHLFMSTIYDFQQSTFDVSVIDELGKMASEDMMNAVDEIINMKLRRFNMFPTKVVMSSFILVAGLAIGILLFNFQDLGFGGEMGFDIEQSSSSAADNLDESEDAVDDGTDEDPPPAESDSSSDVNEVDITTSGSSATEGDSDTR